MALALVSPGGAHASVPAGNLIHNPGVDEATGETDSNGAAIPQWGTSGRLSAVKYDSMLAGFPTPADSSAIGGGANFFSGGKDDTTSAAGQLVDIPEAQSEIDAGRVSATLSAYLGGRLDDEDNATVTATFEDAHSDVVFGTVQIGPVTAAERNNVTKLLPRSTVAAVPVGTRRIRIVITATRTAGTHNNGYADNLSLTLDLGPTAVNDSATVARNSGATAVNVLANDTDPDGGPKQVVSVTQPTNGTVAISGGGTGLTYKPNASFCNTQPGGSPDGFTYTVNGGSTATVAMTVTCGAAAPPPTVTTGAASGVAPGTATLAGVVNPQGSSTTYHFEYGASVAYGSSTANASAGAGSADQMVGAPLSGLASGATYHYRLVATSAGGTTLGADRAFVSASVSCGSLPAPPAKPAAGPPVTRAASLTGTVGANTIVGTAGADRITALAGNDCVLGLGGNDTIDAGPGDDRVEADGPCPPATQTPFCIPGSPGNDLVRAGIGDDIVDGGAGKDTLSGQGGDDRLRGDSGNDRVAGGSGSDILSGQNGKDSLDGNSGDDILRGGTGNDRIDPGAGNDRVEGGGGNDRISARDGERDQIACGHGRDKVTADRNDQVDRDCERVSRR